MPPSPGVHRAPRPSARAVVPPGRVRPGPVRLLPTYTLRPRLGGWKWHRRENARGTSQTSPLTMGMPRARFFPRTKWATLLDPNGHFRGLGPVEPCRDVTPLVGLEIARGPWAYNLSPAHFLAGRGPGARSGFRARTQSWARPGPPTSRAAGQLANQIRHRRRSPAHQGKVSELASTAGVRTRAGARRSPPRARPCRVV
jgi:hypothetical protein